MTTTDVPAELPVPAETSVPSIPSVSPGAHLPHPPGLGRAPLIRGEEVSNYDTVLARIAAAVKPADFVEETFLRDVADLLWDAIRMRRMKADLLSSTAHEGMRELLRNLGVEESNNLAKCWAAGDTQEKQEAEALLAGAGLTIDHVMAHTMRSRLHEVEQFERLIADAEARRNAALRNIAAYRADFAERVRRAAQDVEDAEYTDVTPAPAEQAAAEHAT